MSHDQQFVFQALDLVSGLKRGGEDRRRGASWEFFLKDYRPRPPPLGGPLGAGPPLLGTGPGPPPGPQPLRPPRPDGP